MVGVPSTGTVYAAFCLRTLLKKGKQDLWAQDEYSIRLGIGRTIVRAE